MSDEEVWKPIPDRPGYEASNLGRIRSLRRRQVKILKPCVSNGYLQVNLGKYTRKVHNLVMLTFVGPCPSGLEICHGPGGRFDNRLSNLRYDTHLSNMRDTIKNDDNPSRKLSLSQAIEIRKLRKEGYSEDQLASIYSVSDTTIFRIISGQTYPESL